MQNVEPDIFFFIIIITPWQLCSARKPKVHYITWTVKGSLSTYNVKKKKPYLDYFCLICVART